MSIRLTEEQEKRIEAVMRRGAYESVEEVLDAALAAVEQRTVPGFTGTQQQLDALLLEGLASQELSADEFWRNVNRRTDSLLAKPKARARP